MRRINTVTVKSHKPKPRLLKWKIWIFGNLIACIILMLAIVNKAESATLLDLEVPVRITVGGYSKHIWSESITNESHDYVAVAVGPVELGRFNNSFDRESYYLAYEATWENVWPDVDLFLKSGVVYGYVDCIDRGSSIPEKKSPREVYKLVEGVRMSEREGKPVDTSGAWCPMAVPGARYTEYFIEPELTLVGDALTISASFEFDLMRIGGEL